MNHAAHRLGAGGLAVAAFAPSWNEARRAADCETLIRAGRCARRLGQWLLLLGALLLGASAGSLLARHGLVMFNLPWLATMASILAFPSGWATAVTRPHVQRIRRLFAAAAPATCSRQLGNAPCARRWRAWGCGSHPCWSQWRSHRACGLRPTGQASLPRWR